MTATRSEVYDAIDGERAYQNDGHGNARRHEGYGVMTPGELLLGMTVYLGKAIQAWYKPNGGMACLDDVRKVTALGVQLMERHGAPRRVFPQRPISYEPAGGPGGDASGAGGDGGAGGAAGGAGGPGYAPGPVNNY